MTTRWIVSAVAAVGAGVLAVPMLLGGRDRPEHDGPPLMASHERPAVCKAKGNANLDLTIKDMNGADVRLADFKGKVVLVNFWATWCGPCKVEIPAFVELYDRYKDRGLVILGVSPEDDPDALRAFAKEYKMNYPVLDARDREDVLDAYGPIWGYPTSYFIARDGSICNRHLGPASKEEFEREIKALL